MNLCIRKQCLRPSLLSNLYRFSTTSPEVIEQNDQVLIDDSDDAKARELEIQKKRNISRLSKEHYNLVNGRVPYEQPLMPAHKTVKYNRKMYGKYGADSGVNPSLCWPSKVDIEERQEYESVAFPYSIPEMMEMAAQKRKAEQEKINQREQEVLAKYAKLALWKKELNDKVAKKAKEAQTAKNKKERLVEEVRRHFGFTLDPRDERFQEMLAKREKEQKKLDKKAKMEAKEKVMMAKLQQQNVELGGAAKKS